ncbi:MAG: hypothetical protein J1E98_09955 [Lachnospiraceae bacterium]|nr:hypothetical protein [Lachnospiraceae bacterium]
MKKIDSKKWFIGMVSSLAVIFLACGLCVFIIDPFLHYRQAKHGMIFHTTSEPDLERYLDSGIIKNFEYDAVIAGTSMAENFKTSEFDELFSVKSVKLPISGGSFKEVNNICEKALIEQPDMKIIIRSLDLSGINADKDLIKYGEYPNYLYDDNWINDINYLLSKNSLIKGCMVDIAMSVVRGRSDFSFDSYANWNNMFEFGEEAVLSSYERPMKSEDFVQLSEEERAVIKGNIEQNVIELAVNYPNTRFVLFFTPYSICYWDTLSREGMLQKEIQIQEEVIEMLLPYGNIELYSFCDNFELVCNLDNYRDQGHYSEDVNSDILRWVVGGEYRLTEDNYEVYLEEITEFYSNYDYEGLYD